MAVAAQNSFDRVLLTALDHAIEHLQVVVFDEGMDSLASQIGSEAALRESVLRYEQGLAQLFGFMRASGALPDAVAWSTLKADERRAAFEAGIEISLRTALETGMYAAESVPLGDHRLYRAWSSAMTAFLRGRARAAGGFPAGGTDEERLYQAYETLSDLEDHDAFHGAFLGDVNAARHLSAAEREAVAVHQSRLLALPRFDLVLNACLLWLAEHGGRVASAG
ncbi:MAG TPA: hypothetical protein VMM78_11900 [Thermomicrobiales bacterium]|nr:hypothetical protein [Thermomicrobiales bacterium]